MGTGPYTSVQIHCRSTVNPNVNFGLWVIVMCPNRFFHCNKWTTLVGDVANGEVRHVRGQGACGKSLYLLPNVSVFKIEVFKKQKKGKRVVPDASYLRILPEWHK